jgi:hypothetical protein
MFSDSRLGAIAQATAAVDRAMSINAISDSPKLKHDPYFSTNKVSRDKLFQSSGCRFFKAVFISSL